MALVSSLAESADEFEQKPDHLPVGKRIVPKSSYQAQHFRRPLFIDRLMTGRDI